MIINQVDSVVILYFVYDEDVVFRIIVDCIGVHRFSINNYGVGVGFF